MSVFRHHVNVEGFIKRFPVSSTIIFINTIVFILTLLLDIFTNYSLIGLGGLNYYAVVTYKQYYRIITAIFLHVSPMHFLFNTLFGIAIICAGLEKLIGSWKYAIAYLGSGLISSIIVIFFSSTFITVGASGAIYGVLGVFLYIIIDKKHLLSYSDRIYIRNLFIINLIFTFVGRNISEVGHIGGVMAGIILGFILLKFDKRDFYYYYD